MTLPRFGVAAGYALAVLCLAYVVVLAFGLHSLPSRDHQIQQPWFALMEILILGIAPVMVMLAVALHAWAPLRYKSVALLGMVFMSMCAAVTCSVHFAILALNHQRKIAAASWSGLVISFRWPSLAYALDILAWDFFFPLVAICAAISVSGSELATATRVLLYSGAALSFAGLAGVPMDDMDIRNIGVVGYTVFFPVTPVMSGVSVQGLAPAVDLKTPQGCGEKMRPISGFVFRGKASQSCRCRRWHAVLRELQGHPHQMLFRTDGRSPVVRPVSTPDDRVPRDRD